MKFFAITLMALGASAAPATYNQVHHTVGLGHHDNMHRQVLATPLTTTYNKFVDTPTFTKVVEPMTTYNKVIATPFNAYNKVQAYAYQPTTFVKQAQAVQYVQAPQTVQYVQSPAVQTYVQTPAVQHAAQYRTHEVTLPVHQIDRTVQYLDTPHIEKPAEIQMVRIGATSNPLHIHFDTQSSQLSTSQSHVPVAPAEPKYQETQDDASYLKTDIKKPVIQSVIETVFPQREIKQVVAPLTETVNTVVSRATHERAQYVAPEPVRQAVQTFVKPVEAVQTFVKPAETVQYVQPAVQTYVQPAVQTYVQPEYTQSVQTFVKPATQYVQGQTVEYVNKPVHNFATTILKPTAEITGHFSKNIVIEKSAEY